MRVKVLLRERTGIWSSVGIRTHILADMGFPGSSVVKESSCSAGELGSIPGLGRSPEEGKGSPTPVFWPGESHRLYSLWGRRELDRLSNFHSLTHSVVLYT